MRFRYETDEWSSLGMEADRRLRRVEGSQHSAAVEKPEERRKPKRLFRNRKAARRHLPTGSVIFCTVGSSPSCKQ